MSDDDELIGYCELHCKTERALFNADHINRMVRLAGLAHLNQPVVGWHSMHDEMATLCKMARAAREAASIATPEPTPPPHRYGCHNRPRPTPESSYQGQAGWRDAIDHDSASPTRLPIMVDIKHMMTTTCQYDKRTTDQACAGCQHIGAPA